MTVCDDNIKLLCDQPDPEKFVQSIITGDETWVSTYEPDSKQQSQTWLGKGQRLKKACSASVKKTIMTAFFDCKGIIMIEFLVPGDTVKSETYI